MLQKIDRIKSFLQRRENFTFIYKTLLYKLTNGGDRRSAIKLTYSYEKFIILGHQRSGSSYLADLLKSHPNTRVYNELFVKGRMGFNHSDFDNFDLQKRILRNENPLAFLEDIVFQDYKEPIKAVGFKLFPEQINKRYWKDFWGWCRLNDVKIIRLERKNYLESYVSLKLAKKSGVWSFKNKNEKNKLRIRVELKKLKRYKEKREFWNESITELQIDHLQISYEELHKDLVRSVSRVLEYLNLDNCNLSSIKIKQEKRAMSEVIINYNETLEFSKLL